MEPANSYKGERATVAEGYDNIPDESLSAIYLAMEEERSRTFGRRSKRETRRLEGFSPKP